MACPQPVAAQDMGITDLFMGADLGEHLPLFLRASVRSEDLIDWHTEGRPFFLKRVKELGVSALPVRQQIANAVGKLRREGPTAFAPAPGPESDSLNVQPPPPPGFLAVTLRCAGNLGGDYCPGKGHLRNTTVHTRAGTVREFYEEMQGARGYALDFANVRVSVDGNSVDGPVAAQMPMQDGSAIMFIGPNNGG